MQRSSLALALLPALMVSASPLAADTGAYAALGAGWTESDLSAGEIQRDLSAAGFPNTTSVDDDDNGWRVLGGYRFNRNLAVEGGFVDLGETESTSRVTGGNPGTIRGTAETDGFFLSGVGGFPVTDALFAYAKVGLLYWETEAESTAALASGTATTSGEDDGTDLGLGLGVAYSVNERFAVRADWDRYQLGGDVDADVDLYTIGLQVKF